MSQFTSGRIRTFHVTFEGAGTAGIGDEQHHARAVADRYDTEHEEIEVSQQEALSSIPAVLDALDEPFGVDSVVPTYVVSKAARRYVTVALSGDGPDELLGGYGVYRGEQVFRFYRHLPTWVREWALPALASRLPASGEDRFSIQARRLQRFLRGARGDQADRYFQWLRLWDDFNRSRMLAGGALATRTDEEGRAIVGNAMRRYPLDAINQMLFFDTRIRLPDQVLTKVDLMSMRHGLEVRSPFLDYRVAELAFQLPGNLKISGATRKRVLMAAAGDLLPPSIRRRGKQGFDLPVGQWLRRELGSLFRDVVTPERLREIGIVSPKGIETLYREHCSGHRDHSWSLWVTLVLCWWWFSPRRSVATIVKPIAGEGERTRIEIGGDSKIASDSMASKEQSQTHRIHP